MTSESCNKMGSIYRAQLITVLDGVVVVWFNESGGGCFGVGTGVVCTLVGGRYT